MPINGRDDRGSVFTRKKYSPTTSFKKHWVKEEQSNVITSQQIFANLKIRLSFGNNEIVFVSKKTNKNISSLLLWTV